MSKWLIRIAGAPRVAPLPVMPWVPDSEAPRRLRNFIEEMLEDPPRRRTSPLAIYADEIYLTVDGLETQHLLAAAQAAADRGSDIVRSGSGHITVTPIEPQVNPAGHIDTDKSGAVASHDKPDQEENETEIGSTDVTDVEAKTTTAEVDGVSGLALTELTRIAWADESGVRNLYAFFRVGLADYKGHVTGVLLEVKSPAIPILSPDNVWLELDAGELKHVGPNSTAFAISGCAAEHVFDGTGHCIGWYHVPVETRVWYSPWGFADPEL